MPRRSAFRWLSSTTLALAALVGATAAIDGCSGEDTGSTRQAAVVSNDLVISQVYGAGGNSGATYKNDFVELFNRGASPVQLSGYSLQYASQTGTFSNSSSVYDLPSFSLQPGQYYLVQLAGGSNGVALPAADTSTTAINMSGTTGKIALVATGSKLAGCGSGGTPCTVGGWIDFVGFGAASQYEGANPTAAISTTTSAFRASGGCVDTGDNGADFSVANVAPRTSSSPLNPCATDAGADASDAAVDAAVDASADAPGDADDGGVILVDAGADADDGSVVVVDAGADADDGSVVVDAGADADDGSVVADAGADADDGSVVADAGADADDGSVVADAGADADDGGVVVVDAGADADDGGVVVVDAGADADDGGVVVVDAGADADDGSVVVVVDASANDGSMADAGADATTDAGADADADAGADAGADADAAADAAPPIDAATDAKPAPGDATVDGGSDAGDGASVGGGGCSCNESGRPTSNAGAVVLTLGVALVLRRRRRGQRAVG
jgi:hypothetical protein